MIVNTVGLGPFKAVLKFDEVIWQSSVEFKTEDEAYAFGCETAAAIEKATAEILKSQGYR